MDETVRERMCRKRRAGVRVESRGHPAPARPNAHGFAPFLLAPALPEPPHVATSPRPHRPARRHSPSRLPARRRAGAGRRARHPQRIGRADRIHPVQRRSRQRRPVELGRRPAASGHAHATADAGARGRTRSALRLPVVELQLRRQAFDGVAPWTNLNAPLVASISATRTRPELIVTVRPTVEWAYESGANTGDALTYGAVASARRCSHRISCSDSASASFRRIDKTQALPFLIVNWKFADNWRIANPFPAGPDRRRRAGGRLHAERALGVRPGDRLPQLPLPAQGGRSHAGRRRREQLHPAVRTFLAHVLEGPAVRSLGRTRRRRLAVRRLLRTAAEGTATTTRSRPDWARRSPGGCTGRGARWRSSRPCWPQSSRAARRAMTATG